MTKKIKSDERRYEVCRAFNPEGVPEDQTRCVEKVWAARYDSAPPRQCQRKRGHGPGGLYCKQHAKKLSKEQP